MSKTKTLSFFEFAELAHLDLSAEYEISTGNEDQNPSVLLPRFEVPEALEESLKKGLLHSAASSRREEELLVTVSFELIGAELFNRVLSDPRILRTLDWREFEKVLAGILEKLEYEIELQQGTKDGGIDIFALKRSGPFGVHRYLLQAKRWSKPVGVQPVRELMFLHNHHSVTKSCLATTSRFTEGAWALAEQYKWQLELKDYDRLLEWIAVCKAKVPR